MERREWSEKQVNLLKQYWVCGVSASIIAEKIGDGVTRNAVIGKVHRLGLMRKHRHPSLSRLRRPKQIKAKPPVQESPPMVPEPKPQIPTTPPEPKNVSIFDLNSRHCRSIVNYDEGGMALFCGAETAGEKSSWCPYHQSIYFNHERRR